MKYTLSTALICTLFLSTAFVVKFSSGKAGSTGSPGEGTCAACHSGGSGVTSVSISATPAFTGGQYIPGTTYTINVMVSNASYSLFGFGCEILDFNTNSNAGIMSSPGTGVQFLTAPNGRKNATHTAPKSGSGGSATFSFVWTSPSVAIQTGFFASANGVNGNGTTSGDAVGNFSMVITPDVSGLSQSSSEALNQIKMFPIPASNFINMEAPSDVKNASFELYDLTGNKISDLKFCPNSEKNNSVKIFLPENVSNGIYLVKMYSDNNVHSRLIIIHN
jgi:hypothetical protein